MDPSISGSCFSGHDGWRASIVVSSVQTFDKTIAMLVDLIALVGKEQVFDDNTDIYELPSTSSRPFGPDAEFASDVCHTACADDGAVRY